MLALVPVFMAGIAAGSLCPGLGRWALCLICICFVLILHFIKKQKNCLFPPLFLFFALGYLSLQQWTAPAFPDNHVTKYADLEKYNISGIINSPPYNDNFRIKFVMKAEAVGLKLTRIRPNGL